MCMFTCLFDNTLFIRYFHFSTQCQNRFYQVQLNTDKVKVMVCLKSDSFHAGQSSGSAACGSRRVNMWEKWIPRHSCQVPRCRISAVLHRSKRRYTRGASSQSPPAGGLQRRIQNPPHASKCSEARITMKPWQQEEAWFVKNALLPKDNLLIYRPL